MLQTIPERTSSAPMQAIEIARGLHDQLLNNGTLPGAERRTLARQISGHLFAAEADHILPDACRAFFLRLRTDAFQRAAFMDANRLPHRDRIDAGYDEIENGLRPISGK